LDSGLICVFCPPLWLGDLCIGSLSILFPSPRSHSFSFLLTPGDSSFLCANTSPSPSLPTPSDPPLVPSMIFVFSRGFRQLFLSWETLCLIHLFLFQFQGRQGGEVTPAPPLEVCYPPNLCRPFTFSSLCPSVPPSDPLFLPCPLAVHFSQYDRPGFYGCVQSSPAPPSPVHPKRRLPPTPSFLVWCPSLVFFFFFLLKGFPFEPLTFRGLYPSDSF